MVFDVNLLRGFPRKRGLQQRIPERVEDLIFDVHVISHKVLGANELQEEAKSTGLKIKAVKPKDASEQEAGISSHRRSIIKRLNKFC